MRWLLAPTLFALSAVASAGEIDPPGAPAPTSGSLDQVAAALLPQRDPAVRLSSFGPETRFALTLTAADGSPEIIGDDTVNLFTDVIEVYGVEVESAADSTPIQQNQSDLAFLRQMAVIKEVDATSPLFLHAFICGREFETAELRVLANGHTASWRLEPVRITSYQLGATAADGGGTGATETITITYTGLEYEDIASGLTVSIAEDGSCTLTTMGGL